MKYDIPRLLALRENASIEIGKFSIHALESRRKANSNVLAERSINRSRVPSSVSVTQNENPSSVPEDKLQYPRRQPRNAPRSTLAQADSGFAQFLKEHTSPKHHRVTAGGRIVPMNPEKSVPEFKPAAKKTKDDDPKKVTGPAVSGKSRKRNTASGTSTKSFSGCSNVNYSSSEANPVTPAISGTATPFTGPDASGSQQSHALHQTTQLPVPALITPFYQQQPLSFASNTYPLFRPTQAGQEYIPLLANLAAAHQTADALGWFPSMVQPFAASNRHIAQSPPFNPSLVGTGSSFQMAANRGVLTMKSGAADSLSAVSSSYPFIANVGNFSPYTATPPASCPLPLSGYITDPAAQRSLQDVTKEYENLTSQLVNLDRYMAIHTFEMDASMKKTLVEQRKGLVRDLDAARRYKEHLESSLRQSGPGIIDAETASNLRLQPNLLQTYAGDAADNFGVSAATWMSPMMANNVQPIWTPNPLGVFQTSSLPFTNEAFNTRAALQFPVLGSLPSIPDIGSWSEYQPNVSVSYSDCMANQDLSTGKPEMPSCNNTQTSQATDDGIQTDERTTSMNSAPPEIRRVYRKIEEAAKRGEPLGGLLRELANITELFISRPNVRCDAPADREHLQASSKPSNMDKLGVAPSQISPKEHQKKEEGRPPISTIVGESDDVTKPGSCRTETRMCTCKSVRCQMSDEDGEDGASCCSGVSVADSWATTEERDGQCTEQIIKENDKGNQKNIARESNADQNGDVAINTDDTIEWIRRVNEMAPARQKHSQSAKPSNPSELPVNQPTSDEIRRSRSMIFTPWKPKEDQDVYAVKVCSPVISRVNAHGFLPPFDGAGDMPSPGGSNRSSVTFTGLRISEEPQTMSGHSGRPWYLKEPRQKPNPVEIRTFFRQTAEEEREMIHKYRIQDHGEA